MNHKNRKIRNIMIALLSGAVVCTGLAACGNGSESQASIESKIENQSTVSQVTGINSLVGKETAEKIVGVEEKDKPVEKQEQGTKETNSQTQTNSQAQQNQVNSQTTSQAKKNNTTNQGTSKANQTQTNNNQSQAQTNNKGTDKKLQPGVTITENDVSDAEIAAERARLEKEREEFRKNYQVGGTQQ